MALLLALAVPLTVPRPPGVEAATGLANSLTCVGDPEGTTLTNTSGATIKIKTVGSLVNPLAVEPFAVNYSPGAGKTATDQTGENTTGRTLTDKTIDSNANPYEGVRVTTSVGTFTKRCPAPEGGWVRIALNCVGNPETTKVTNRTSVAITIESVGSRYQPRSNEPFSVGTTLGAGKSYTYQSGPAAATHGSHHMRIIGQTGARVTIAGHGYDVWRGLMDAKGWRAPSQVSFLDEFRAGRALADFDLAA